MRCMTSDSLAMSCIMYLSPVSGTVDARRACHSKAGPTHTARLDAVIRVTDSCALMLRSNAITWCSNRRWLAVSFDIKLDKCQTTRQSVNDAIKTPNNWRYFIQLHLKIKKIIYTCVSLRWVSDTCLYVSAQRRTDSRAYDRTENGLNFTEESISSKWDSTLGCLEKVVTITTTITGFDHFFFKFHYCNTCNNH